MFHCICLSPAIDALVELPCAPHGGVLRAVRETENVGGKGLNVARWLALRGAPTRLAGILGEDNDTPFAKEMAACGIADAMLRVPGATRRNEMFTWPDGGAVKVNREAFPILPAEAIDPAAYLRGVTRDDLVIISGSLPRALPSDFYGKMLDAAAAIGVRVVLDASGKPMREALNGTHARPWLIKPNVEEAAELLGCDAPREDDADGVAELARKMKPLAAHVVISCGSAGAWFDGEFVAAPNVSAVDTTAAGDTLLAEYCWRIENEDVATAARWAVAAGSAAVECPGSTPPTPARVEELAAVEAR